MATMIKGSVGGPLSLLASIAVLISVFLPFWDERKPYELAIRGLWQGYAGLSEAAFLASLGLVLLLGSLILLASSVAGSQFLSLLGFVWVGGMLADFVFQTRGSTSVSDFLLNDVDYGFWVAAIGALLALIATFISRSIKDDFRR